MSADFCLGSSTPNLFSASLDRVGGSRLGRFRSSGSGMNPTSFMRLLIAGSPGDLSQNVRRAVVPVDRSFLISTKESSGSLMSVARTAAASSPSATRHRTPVFRASRLIMAICEVTHPSDDRQLTSRMSELITISSRRKGGAIAVIAPPAAWQVDLGDFEGATLHDPPFHIVCTAVSTETRLGAWASCRTVFIAGLGQDTLSLRQFRVQRNRRSGFQS